MNFRSYYWIAFFALLSIVSKPSQAAYVVFGAVTSLSKDQRDELYESLSEPRFPDLGKINEHFGASGVQVAFIPNTAYQMIQHHLIESKLLEPKSTIHLGGTAFLKKPVAQLGQDREDPRGIRSLFFENNSKLTDYLKEKGVTGKNFTHENLLKALPFHQEIHKGREDWNQLTYDSLITLYERVIRAEEDAFKHKKVLIFRFTSGVRGSDHLLDSILKVEDGKIRPEVGVHHLSYSSSILDGRAGDENYSPNPFTAPGGGSITAGACTERYLIGAAAQSLFLKDGQRILDFLDEKGKRDSEESAEDAQKRLARFLSRQSLYYLELDETDLKKSQRFLYDPSFAYKPHVLLVQSGELFHPRWVTHDGLLNEEEIEPHRRRDKSTQDHTFDADNVEQFYGLMAKGLHVLYTNAHEVVDEATDPDAKQIHQNYRDFKRDQLPIILQQIRVKASPSPRGP